MPGKSKPRALVAKFRGLKLPVFGKTQIVKCELEIEMRALPSNPELFVLLWRFSGKLATEGRYDFEHAKDTAAQMFAEQIEPWRDLELPAP